MWEIKLFNAARRAVTQKTTTAPIMKFCRSIFRGRGQRTIVSGFTGPNLDASTHFNFLYNLRIRNLRPVIRGFGNQYDHIPGMLVKQIPGLPGQTRLKWFPNFRIPNITRHVVYDLQPQRKVIAGFTKDIAENTKGQIYTKPVKIPTGKELVAEERVVIQGFSTNTSTTPVTKKMDLTNSNPRVVVKGFGG